MIRSLLRGVLITIVSRRLDENESSSLRGGEKEGDKKIAHSLRSRTPFSTSRCSLALPKARFEWQDLNTL